MLQIYTNLKKFLKAMQTPEEEILPKIKAAVQHQKSR